MTKLATAVSALFMASRVAALDPIIVKGSKFFYENGTQFFMKGIAYQEDPSGAGGENADGKYLDPLADKEKCERDIPILAKAHTNTIRVYSIDPTKDHDDCMKLLQENGIYVVADLGEPSTSIDRDNPQWTVELFQRYKDVVDVLAEYDNVIGFFAGNEVSNNSTNTGASAFVKAAVRDTKAYIKSKDTRWMGVGYAANDDPDIRGPSAHYFNCGDQDDAIDFWGYNIYSWCGQSTMQQSGYDKQVEFYSNYSVPVFLAEYGCNAGGVEKRLFQDTTALYSDDMSHVFSGGIVYMYFQEENDYGLVEIDSDGEAETMKNYDVYSSRVAEATPSSTSASDYEPTNSPAACPPLQENWKVNADALPPTPDSDLCECMYNTLSCVPKSNIRAREMKSIFDFICSEDEAACAGIVTNPETGIYGAYSMCSDKQKVAYVMNEYYQNQDQTSDACDHDGLGEIVDAPGADSTCSAGLSAAESVNEHAATATVAPASSGSAGGDDDEEDDDESFGVASRRMDMAFTLGDYAVGLYVVVAGGVGAAMVML